MDRPWQEANKYKQVIQHQWIEIRETERGRGIFSTVAHPKGTLVAAFVGQPITIPLFRTKEEAEAFEKSKDGEYAVTYAWDAGKNVYRAVRPDPDKIGGHLANHSCNPNAKITELYRGALMMRATRPVQAGDEITIDYHWQRPAPIPCLCGSDPCTGNIGLTYTLVDVPVGDGATNTYLNFDPAQVIKLLQVAEAHRNIDALRVLRIRDQWMAKEALLKYFQDAFGSGRRDAWLTQNFHRLARSPLSSAVG
ncbi:MAG: SET domain-containing protein [Polyangiaceae bacterium]|jgi:hypothetical protein